MGSENESRRAPTRCWSSRETGSAASCRTRISPRSPSSSPSSEPPSAPRYELETVQRPMGWTWPGFRVLFWISLLGPLEPREIATLASASRASVSSALNTLERNGFVTRSRGSADRRLVTVGLTARGSERIAEAFAATNRREQELVAGFSVEERRTLAELLGAARLLLDDQKS